MINFNSEFNGLKYRPYDLISCGCSFAIACNTGFAYYKRLFCGGVFHPLDSSTHTKVNLKSHSKDMILLFTFNGDGMKSIFSHSNHLIVVVSKLSFRALMGYIFCFFSCSVLRPMKSTGFNKWSLRRFDKSSSPFKRERNFFYNVLRFGQTILTCSIEHKTTANEHKTEMSF